MDAYVEAAAVSCLQRWRNRPTGCRKQQAQFARQIDATVNRREVKGIEPSFVDFAQELLRKAGVPLASRQQKLLKARRVAGITLSDFVYKMDQRIRYGPQI